MPPANWKCVRFLWAPYGEIWLPARDCNVLFNAGLVEKIGWGN